MIRVSLFIADRHGLTLAELLVGIYVLTMIGGLMVAAYISIGNFTRSEQTRIEVDVSASQVLTDLDQFLRQVKAIEAQYPLSGAPTYTTGPTILVFSIPAAGTLPTTNNDLAVLYVENNELKLLIDAHAASSRVDETRVITRNASDLYLRYNAGTPTTSTAVTMTLKTEKTAGGNSYTQTAIIHETFRNHP